MSISKDLFLAILSMDAYNREYGAGVAVLGSFGRIANKSEVFIHSVAAGQVDKELLDKLKAAKG